jgi:hypothetical protein
MRLPGSAFPAALILGFLLLLHPARSFSQDTARHDTIYFAHSPNKAALYSAILPGLGQAYNKKYWKIPLVYAGFGTMAYFLASNISEYSKFKDAFDYKSGDSIPSKYNSYVDKYPLTSLQEGKDYYRRNRDFTYIVMSLWYILNIVDAAVDAYLFTYDISDNLSLHWEPSIMGTTRGQAGGIKFDFRF